MRIQNFKIGDRVVRARGGSNGNMHEGDEGTVVGFDGPSVMVQADKDGQSLSHSHDPENLDLIEVKKSTTMINLKESFVIAFLPEPEKSLRKAGITNGDGILTDEGVKIFLTYMLRKNATDFVQEIVAPMLAEQKEQKSC
jgi:hypothetical protein